MDSFWSCDHRGTSWFRMTKLPFSSDSRVWVDMAVLHPGLVSSPHLILQTQMLERLPGESGVLLDHGCTTDIPLPPSPSQKRVETELGVSELHRHYFF